MSKSIPSILGMGVAACVLLSLMMRDLVKHQTKREPSPYTPAVESKLGSRLVGSVSVEEQRDGGWLQLVVRARVLAGLNKQRIANTVGLEVWLGAQRAGRPPNEVIIVLDDDAGGEPLRVSVAAPRRR